MADSKIIASDKIWLQTTIHGILTEKRSRHTDFSLAMARKLRPSITCRKVATLQKIENNVSLSLHKIIKTQLVPD